jgi:hypothetical protein
VRFGRSTPDSRPKPLPSRCPGCRLNSQRGEERHHNSSAPHKSCDRPIHPITITRGRVAHPPTQHVENRLRVIVVPDL